MPKTTIFYQKVEGKQPEPEKPHEWYAFWDDALPGRYAVTIELDQEKENENGG